MTKTYVDTFNRANAGSWGTSSDGLWTWQLDSGTSIVDNQGRMAPPAPAEYGAADARAQCDTDSMYSECDLIAFNNDGGLIFYLGLLHPDDDSASYALGYDGTDLLLLGPSGLLDSTPIASPVGKRLRVQRFDPSNLMGVYVDGVLTLSATSAAYPTGSNRRGVQIALVADETSSYVTIDNFRYGDIVFMQPFNRNRARRSFRVIP
jgi:hypothetical protein